MTIKLDTPAATPACCLRDGHWHPCSRHRDMTPAERRADYQRIAGEAKR